MVLAVAAVAVFATGIETEPIRDSVPVK